METRLWHRRGQTIIESMIALSALTVGFLGIVGLLNRSLVVSRVATENYVASYLASEGIEVIKNLIDTNALQGNPWNEGILGTWGVQYDTESLSPAAEGTRAPVRLRFDDVNKVYNYETGNQTPFRRSVRVDLVGADGHEVRVSSRVNWTSTGGGSFSVNVEGHFFRAQL